MAGWLEGVNKEQSAGGEKRVSVELMKRTKLPNIAVEVIYDRRLSLK